MSNRLFDVGTVPPPPWPPAMPGYSPMPPGPPAPDRRRSWPGLATAGVVGAVVAAAAAAIITAQARDTTAAPPQTSAPVTVTVPAPPPPLPAPLPTAQADRQTCDQGWDGTDVPTKSAAKALDILPPGVTVLDPAVQENPEWAAAVRRAGGLYLQASEGLATQIAPGTTPILAQAANTAAKALRVLGDSHITFDPISGNAHHLAVDAANQMAVLCTRLAP